MSDRIRTDNFIWALCCCGCLPIIGLIKGLIVVIPVSILSVFGFTGIALVLLPHDIVYTYRALIKTSIIGINLKILAFLLLPIALVAWPVLVLFVSCCFGFFFGLFGPVVKTFDSKYDLFFGGISDIIYDTLYFIENFWDFNYHSFFIYLLKIEDRKVNEPFDINIIQLILSLILACYGSIVGVIVLSVMWFIKLIPTIYRLYRYLIELLLEFSLVVIFMFSIFFILGFCCVPALGVASILLYIGYALFGGIRCAIEGYKYNFLRGLISIWDTIHCFDSITNSYIFNTENSCLPDCSETYKYKKNKRSKVIKIKNSDNVKKITDITEENKFNNNEEPPKKENNQEKKVDEADIAQELIV